MGRIEDALRRAAMTADGVRALDHATPTAAPVRIDEYPAEREAGAARARPPRVSRKSSSERPSPPPGLLAHASVRIGESAAGKVVIDPSTPGPWVEQYRRLAGTLHQMQAERSIKTIMISSALPREGKTLTSSNLALTLSTSFRRRVLLIDGDLRRPSVHEVFKLPGTTTGLSDVFRSGTATVPLIEVTPYLTVLTAGRPDANPTAGLASVRMREILAEAAERFDWVVVDSAPVGLLPDARLIANQVDGVILVIGATSTDYRLVQHAIDEIGRDRILGTVLNRAESDAATSSAYYDGYYYAGTTETAV